MEDKYSARRSEIVLPSGVKAPTGSRKCYHSYCSTLIGTRAREASLVHTDWEKQFELFMKKKEREKKTSVFSNCSDSGVSTSSSMSDDEDDFDSTSFSNRPETLDLSKDIDKWIDFDFSKYDDYEYSTSPVTVQQLHKTSQEKPSPRELRNEDVRGLVKLLRSKPQTGANIGVTHGDRKADLVRQMCLAWS